MSAVSRPVSVTHHARDRWVQRVDPDDPFPRESVREALKDAVTDDGSDYYELPDRGVTLVALPHEGELVVVTVLSECGTTQEGR